jgi:HK97 family phage portal protein
MNPLSAVRQWSARMPGPSGITGPLGQQRALGYSGSGGYVPAAPVLSGTFVTPETALGLSAVFSAINVIARDYAGLPRHVYRIYPDGGKEIETKGELGVINDLIAFQPNNDMDAYRWSRDGMGHVLGRGNWYNEIVRKNGFVQSLEILHPAKTVPKRTDGSDGGSIGRLYYELDNKKRLAAEDCLHFAGLGFDGIIGYSPITLMRQTIGLAMAAEQYGAAFFGNGAVAHGWLKTAKKLSEAAVNNLRKTFNQIHQGSQSAHQVGILEEGMDWQQNSISPEDSQFVSTREFQVKDIARMYSIPPHKIGDYSESHLANVEEANLDYVAMTLMGWVVMNEFQMNSKLLTREQRATHRIECDMSALLRGNIQAQMLRATTLRNTGAWSADDIRRDQGLNPLGPKRGGDVYVIQGQYVPLDQIGKQPAKVPAPGSTEQKGAFPTLEARFANYLQTNGIAA